jgi:hypothetical protein
MHFVFGKGFPRPLGKTCEKKTVQVYIILVYPLGFGLVCFLPPARKGDTCGSVLYSNRQKIHLTKER